jgi:hypothetical protein
MRLNVGPTIYFGTLGQAVFAMVILLEGVDFAGTDNRRGRQIEVRPSLHN